MCGGGPGSKVGLHGSPLCLESKTHVSRREKLYTLVIGSVLQEGRHTIYPIHFDWGFIQTKK